MLYLTQGLVCIDETDGRCFIHNLVTGTRQHIDEDQAEYARQLVRGVDGRQAELVSEVLSPLESHEFAIMERREEPFDRVVKHRFERLDACFSWSLPDDAGPLLDLCEHAHSLLRHSRLDLDQLPVLPETAARRALLLSRLCRPRARVALVGDDDLVSIAAAACGLRPTVLDIDPDLVHIIELLSQRFDLDIEARLVDLRQPLPEELIGQFDSFCTDPENSRTCVSLFLSRGVSLVRDGGIGLIASAEEWQHLIDDAQERAHLERIAHYRRFNNYRDWELRLAPYRADLHVLSTSSKSVPIVGAGDHFEGELFPFGLSGKDSIMITASSCEPEMLNGGELVDLLIELIDVDENETTVDDHRPFPVRVVTATSPASKAQATVRAQGTTLDLVITPAPSSERGVRRMIEIMTQRLETEGIELRSLQRVEANDV